MLRRNLDLVASAVTAVCFVVVGVPRPLWAAWVALVAAQLGARAARALR